MSFLDKAIKEMRSYGDMGIPDGENGQGMGDTQMIPQGKGGKKVVNAYKLNNILRNRNQAEEEEMNMTSGMNGGMSGEQYPQDGEDEGLSPEEFQNQLAGEDGLGDEMGMDTEMGMGDEMGMDDGQADSGEMQQFFTDNPAPSDEEISQYAQERGIDMQQMRQEVYALIQSLLDTQGGEDMEGGMFGDIGMDSEMGDEMDSEMGDEEGMGTDDMDGAKMSGTGGEMNSTYPSFDFSKGREDEMEINFGNAANNRKNMRK